MHSIQRRTLDSLKRADALVGTAPLPPSMTWLPIGFGEQVNALKQAIASTDSLAAEQQSGASQLNTVARRAFRAELRHGHLIPLRKVARVIERTMPGMPHIINIPKKLSNEQSLVATAVAALRDIAPYTGLFVAKGMPEDFVAQLQASIDAVITAKAAGVEAHARAISATAGIRASLQRGRDAVHCLDTIVRRCCKADPVNGPATLADWDSARHTYYRTNAPPPVASSSGVVAVSGTTKAAA